jgi:thioredoxin reductase (NADPH)
MEQLQQYKCEILIIGAGPAGCSAGIYCGRIEKDVIILEGKQSSALERAKEIKNYPGYDKISGIELLKKFRDQLKKYKKVKIIKGDVISLIIGDGMNMISTRNANIIADAVVIATGRGERKEKIKGEDALSGYGVSYCALCDGPLYKDRVVFLYGNDEDVLEDALILKQMGCIVNIISELSINELPKKIQEVKEYNIKVYDKYKIEEIIGNKRGIIQKIVCKSTDPNNVSESKTFELDALFIMTHLPSNSILKKAGIELDNKGNVKTDQEQQTNVKGVFAAGDVTGGLYQVVFATAQGARAGINANKYVRQLKKN